MQFQSIDDVYAAHDRARSDLKELVSDVTESEAVARPPGEKWSVAQIVEHIASVNDGTFRVCRKLLGKAEEAGSLPSERLNVSDEFLSRWVEIDETKVEAPERVHPAGTVSIVDSLAKLDENRREMGQLKPLFERVDGDKAKFPHPFFGEISAVEWLIMAGGHETRHTKQIRKILATLR
jgi:hypothetical protein